MADNLGIMLAAGGAALIGFTFLAMGKEEPVLKLEEADLTAEYCPDDMSPDGTVLSVNGKIVIPKCPTVASFKIQECDYVNYFDDGTPICGKFGGAVEVPMPEPTDPPEKVAWGLFDWLNGTPQQDEIPDRAGEEDDSRLYVFSGGPDIHTVGITRPAWLTQQDVDPFI